MTSSFAHKMLKTIFYLLLICATPLCSAQLPLTEAELYARVSPTSALPENLLSSRTAVFYHYRMLDKELKLMQGYFYRTGIDAVVYYEMDYLTAGRDVSMTMAQRLLSREIENIVLVRRINNEVELVITPFNKKANFIDSTLPAWRERNRLLEEILKSLNRSASYGLKRENFLINEIPEEGQTINPIVGRRGEFFAVDLKVDPLAVPKFNDEEMDQKLEELMKSYPYKYTLIDPTLSEADLRKQGLLFVLRFVNARAKVAKKAMGYDVDDAETAIVSITYPSDQPALKNIPANEQVFKFYFKHIASQNVYLGTKWDADILWHDALQNQLNGFRKELKVN